MTVGAVHRGPLLRRHFLMSGLKRQNSTSLIDKAYQEHDVDLQEQWMENFATHSWMGSLLPFLGP
jgi:hypothetical protein